jgi:hypothetical protein
MGLLEQFFESGADVITLGAQDFAVLDAYRALGTKSACAADLYTFLRKNLKRDPRLPTIYKIVARLREVGLLEDVGEAVAPEGGRPRRLYRLTQEGRRALSLGYRMAASSGLGLRAYTA